MKNNSHYGALKHLANAGGKPGSLFTRNSLGQQKKLTSFDENVCVNQIRESNTVNQKFVPNQTRFAVRKNYGSVCVLP